MTLLYYKCLLVSYPLSTVYQLLSTFPMVRPYLSVIIPAWNEASRLPLTLIDVDRHLASQKFTSEIIVALSPSSDNSDQILARLVSIIKNLKILPLIENKGKGFALREGMKVARGSYRLIMDADNSVPVIEVLKMLPRLTTETGDRVDIALGSRLVKGGRIEPRQNIWQSMRTLLGSYLNQLFLTPKIKDSRCAFKCFSAAAADKIFPETQMNGRAIETELTMRARAHNYTLIEVPVCWSHDPESKKQSLMEVIGEYLRLISLRLRAPKRK